MANNPIDLYDKTKYADERYYISWHIANIEWINNNRNNEEYLELLHLVDDAVLSS